MLSVRLRGGLSGRSVGFEGFFRAGLQRRGFSVPAPPKNFRKSADSAKSSQVLLVFPLIAGVVYISYSLVGGFSNLSDDRYSVRHVNRADNSVATRETKLNQNSEKVNDQENKDDGDQGISPESDSSSKDQQNIKDSESNEDRSDSAKVIILDEKVETDKTSSIIDPNSIPVVEASVTEEIPAYKLNDSSLIISKNENSDLVPDSNGMSLFDHFREHLQPSSNAAPADIGSPDVDNIDSKSQEVQEIISLVKNVDVLAGTDESEINLANNSVQILHTPLELQQVDSVIVPLTVDVKDVNLANKENTGANDELLSTYDQMLTAEPSDLNAAKKQLSLIADELKVRSHNEAIRLSQVIKLIQEKEREDAAHNLAEVEKSLNQKYIMEYNDKLDVYKREVKTSYENELKEMEKLFEEDFARVSEDSLATISKFTEVTQANLERKLEENEHYWKSLFDSERNDRLMRLRSLEQQLELVSNNSKLHNLLHVSSNRNAELKLLIEDIQDRFNSQLPFEKPLHALAQLVVEIDSSLSSEDKILSTSIEAIPIEFAKTGIPSQKFLLDSFDMLEKETLPISIIPENAGIFHHLTARFFGMFLRPDRSLVSGTSNASKLSRSGYYLQDGSLDLAVEEISQLSGVAKGSSTCHRWLEIARARLMVQQSLNILSDHISLSEATVRKNSKLAFL